MKKYISYLQTALQLIQMAKETDRDKTEIKESYLTPVGVLLDYAVAHAHNIPIDGQSIQEIADYITYHLSPNTTCDECIFDAPHGTCIHSLIDNVYNTLRTVLQSFGAAIDDATQATSANNQTIDREDYDQLSRDFNDLIDRHSDVVEPLCELFHLDSDKINEEELVTRIRNYIIERQIIQPENLLRFVDTIYQKAHSLCINMNNQPVINMYQLYKILVGELCNLI